jgi:membrane-associated phospholipid phosphatase
MALIGAGGSVVLLALTWLMAFHVGIGEHADQSIFRGFTDLRGTSLASLAGFLADLCDPKPFVVFAAAVVVVAFVRGRPRVALATAAILLGANATTQVLKPLLAHPRADWLLGGSTPVSATSWPSGHATAAMSLALCAVLAAPARWRPVLAAVGGLFAVAVSFAMLTLGAHYPSDILGGFLVAATWTLAAIAVLFALDARGRLLIFQGGPRPSLREALGPPALALLGAIAVSLVVVIARPHAVISYAHAHKAFVVGASAIAAIALALATGVMLSLRADQVAANRPTGSAPAPTAAPRRRSPHG